MAKTTLERDQPRTTGWRVVFGRARPGSTRDVERSIAELRRVDPRDWE